MIPTRIDLARSVWLRGFAVLILGTLLSPGCSTVAGVTRSLRRTDPARAAAPAPPAPAASDTLPTPLPPPPVEPEPAP